MIDEERMKKELLLNSVKKITSELIKRIIISSHLFSDFFSHHFQVLHRFFYTFTLTLPFDTFRIEIHYFALVRAILYKFEFRIPLNHQ